MMCFINADGIFVLILYGEGRQTKNHLRRGGAKAIDYRPQAP